ncbi:MAG: hypothetical protein LLF76_15000 [Planctomycetaceae bacterium]|nr:hypothetical protein [Planctomycetaceae bacterium]
MKKFIWPLQRLLDVKGKQENAMRSELMTLTEQCASLRSRMLMEKILLRNLLDELAALEKNERMGRQPQFMLYVHVKDDQITKLAQQLEQAEQQRQKKMQQLLVLRKFRKGLERLRQRAWEVYGRQLNRLEQNQSDENSCLAAARRMAAEI